MHNDQEHEKSRFKLGQLWCAVNHKYNEGRSTNLHKSIVCEILKEDFDINYKVEVTYYDYDGEIEVRLKDCTALHFSYCKVRDIHTFTALLERGADFTLKDGNGQTALHLIIEQCKDDIIEKEMPFMNAIMTAHVKSQNSSNPHNKNGISHLHGACMANHVEALEVLLGNGESVDETVKIDAPKFVGYTPLHFAVKYGAFQVAEILVSRGANINAQNSDGKTPLDMFITEERRFDSKVDIPDKEPILKLFLEKGAVSGIGFSNLQIACTLKDLTFAERLLNEGANIEYSVPSQSPIYPGNTALYFAARNSVEAVKMLLRHGAKIDVVNDKWGTPLRQCVSRYSWKDLCEILSCTEELKGIRLSDGETSLLELIPAMKNLKKFKSFFENRDMNLVVPENSPIWPGYTILHLAVALAIKLIRDATRYEDPKEYMIIEECLKRGADPNIRNAEGKSSVHLAYRMCRYDSAKLMLNYLNQRNQLVDLVYEDNLSYFFMACIDGNETLAEILLNNPEPTISHTDEESKNTFFRLKETRLHTAVFVGSPAIVEMVLRQGASVQATDDQGLTPIHAFLSRRRWHCSVIANLLFDSLLANASDQDLEPHKSSYLHIACYYSHVNAVKKFLNLGSNVNGTIECPSHSGKPNRTLSSLHSFSKFTPLKMAILSHYPNNAILDLLLQSGADVFASEEEKSPKNSRSTLITNKNFVRRYFQILWDRDDMQSAIEERLGLTKLHIACYLKNEEAIRAALNNAIDINAQIHVDSELFPGCTPLHLLMTTVRQFDFFTRDPEFTVGPMIELLLKFGADVTIKNNRKVTPIHVFFKHQSAFFDGDLCKKLLINAHKDFNVNPANSKGISHFHLACHWHEAAVVEKFLQHESCDINLPIDYFARHNTGCTPLHLALCHEMTSANNDDWEKLSQTVDLLSKHGADVAAKDINGDTPMHKRAVLRSPEINILEKLISYGGDIKCRNIKGQTPIDVWPDMLRNSMIFQKYDCKINSWNSLTGEGYISKVFLSDRTHLSESAEFAKYLKSQDVRTVDNVGRTAIHNLVANPKDRGEGKFENYIYAVKSFIKLGINIDHQDNSGQTALHYASRMENGCGTEALLVLGADSNIIDNNGKTAFFYAVELSENKHEWRWIMGIHARPLMRSSTIILRLHIKKLLYLGIEVNQHDQDLVANVQHHFEKAIVPDKKKCVLTKRFFDQVKIMKSMDIGLNPITLFDFLSDTKAVTLYPLLLKSNRDVVDDFFILTWFEGVQTLIGIIRLQRRKMRTRLRLIVEALTSLRALLGFSFPGLCEQISQYLSNTDLKYLIEASTMKTIEKSAS